jgi:malic enzyme
MPMTNEQMTQILKEAGLEWDRHGNPALHHGGIYGEVYIYNDEGFPIAYGPTLAAAFHEWDEDGKFTEVAV